MISTQNIFPFRCPLYGIKNKQVKLGAIIGLHQENFVQNSTQKYNLYFFCLVIGTNHGNLWFEVCGMSSFRTSDCHELLGIKQTGSICEACDRVEHPSPHALYTNLAGIFS